MPFKLFQIVPPVKEEDLVPFQLGKAEPFLEEKSPFLEAPLVKTIIKESSDLLHRTFIDPKAKRIKTGDVKLKEAADAAREKFRTQGVGFTDLDPFVHFRAASKIIGAGITGKPVSEAPEVFDLTFDEATKRGAPYGIALGLGFLAEAPLFMGGVGSGARAISKGKKFLKVINKLKGTKIPQSVKYLYDDIIRISKPLKRLVNKLEVETNEKIVKETVKKVESIVKSSDSELKMLADEMLDLGEEMPKFLRKRTTKIIGKSATEKVDDILEQEANMLRDMEEGLKGGQLVRPDQMVGKQYEFTKRITEHSPAYRSFFKTKKRAPKSLNDWKIIAREQLEAGKSGLNLADDYAKQISRAFQETEVSVAKALRKAPTKIGAKQALKAVRIVGEPAIKAAERKTIITSAKKILADASKKLQGKLYSDIEALGGLAEGVGPVALQKTKGLGIDDMVRELNEVGGYAFRNADDLRNTISKLGEKVVKRGKKTTTAYLRELRKETEERIMRHWKVISPEAKKVPTGPRIKLLAPGEKWADNAQKAYAHLVAAEKGLSKGQYKKLAKIYIGKTSIKGMTTKEADEFIKMLRGVVPGFRGPVIPKSMALVTREAAEQLGKLKDVGIGSKWKSPGLVFKQIGAPAYENIARPMLNAVRTLRAQVSIRMAEIRTWQKQLWGTRLRRKLRFLVTGERYKKQSQRMFDYINKTKGVSVKVSTKEKGIIDKAKVLLDNYADKLDILRAKQGLSPINRLENYITNLVNAELSYAIRANRVDSNLFAMLDNIVPKQVFDPFLLARKGKLPIQRDFWKAIRAYVSISEKKLALDPVLPQAQAFIKQLPPNAQKYAKWFVNDIMGRASEFERLTQNSLQRAANIFGKKRLKIPIETYEGIIMKEFEVPRFRIPTKPLGKIVGKIKMLNYMSFIGANIRTFFVNLTQPIAAAANLPGGVWRNFSDMAYGYAKMMGKVFRRNQWKKMREMGILTEAERLMGEELGITGILADLTMWNMKISEFANRVATTYAGKKAFARVGRKKGVRFLEDEALQLGRELSDMINFRYGLGETPKMFRNPVGQLFYQYNTFAMKHAELLGTMAAKTFKKGQLEAFIKAAEKGQALQYLEQFGPPTRVAFIKYIVYVSGLLATTSAMGIEMGAGLFTKGFIPNQVEAFAKGMVHLARGDREQAFREFGKMIVPPAISKGIPKSWIPMKTQIERLKKGKTFLQKIGLQKIPYGKDKRFKVKPYSKPSKGGGGFKVKKYSK